MFHTGTHYQKSALIGKSTYMSNGKVTMHMSHAQEPSWQELNEALEYGYSPWNQGHYMEFCQWIHIGRKIAGPMTICVLTRDADACYIH